MSENTPFVSTVEFELPIGYTDDEGRIHKHVVMRAILNGDIIAYHNDVEMREMASSKYRLDSGNPAEMMMATALAHKMDNIMYARTILNIGTLERPKITRKLFEQLYESDVRVIQENYLRLNGFDKTAKEAGGEKPPFGQWAS